MKKYVDRMRAIIETADKDLRGVIIEAASAGDLEGVDVAREIAGKVREVLESVGQADQQKAAVDQVDSIVHVSKTRPKRGGRRSRKARYPRFEVQDRLLKRVGWSKKKKGEYTHKVTRRAYDRIITAIEAVSRNKGANPATAEEVTEILSSDTDPVPGYQVYVVIGFLRGRGCIEQIGRSGYRVADGVSARAKRAWDEAKGES